MGIEFLKNKDNTLTLIAKQGTTWSFVFFVNNPDNTPADLTGYSARGQIRATYKHTTVVASFTCTITDNSVRCYIPASVTATIPAYKYSVSAKTLPKWDMVTDTPGCYVFDIELYQDENSVYRPVEGVLFVDPEVTK